MGNTASLNSGTALLTTLNIFVLIVFMFSYLEGINSTWYSMLKQPTIDVWIPRVGWIIATILSYVGLYLIFLTASPHRVLVVSDLYIISGFLAILWSATFYQLRDISLAVWFSFILFLYQLWLLIYLFRLEPLLSLFLIPSVIMYFYLVYSMISLALLNNIPL
jgi:tryptophan-rich sensory protein